MSDPTVVLCFGDSNTWGYDPVQDRRLGPRERWPGVLQDALGDSFLVVEEGLPGRTTVWDDPTDDDKNGSRHLRPLLDSHQPDVVILLLGTNDLKHQFGLSADDISRGVARLIRLTQERPPIGAEQIPKVLVVCPPPIEEKGVLASLFSGGATKSRGLAQAYRLVAANTGSRFFDADAIIHASGSDGVHWEARQHVVLGQALSALVRQQYPQLGGGGGLGAP